MRLRVLSLLILAVAGCTLFETPRRPLIGLWVTEDPAFDPRITPSVKDTALTTVGPLRDIGSSWRLHAVALDADSGVVRDPSVSWRSSDSTIAAVTQAGVVTVHARGSFVITALLGGVSGTRGYTIPDCSRLPNSVTPSTVDITVGARQQFVWGGQHEACPSAVTWRSSNEHVAVIDSLGVAIAVDTGITTIIAKLKSNPSVQGGAVLRVRGAP